jgi:hypothetical protein
MVEGLHPVEGRLRDDFVDHVRLFRVQDQIVDSPVHDEGFDQEGSCNPIVAKLRSAESQQSPRPNMNLRVNG